LFGLGRRMHFEPGSLGGGQFGGVFAEVPGGFQGQFAGDFVGVASGDGLECGGPAIRGVEDLGKGLAEIEVARAVVVQVVGELVGDGGELVEELAGILLAAGAAGFGVEVMEFLGAEVEEFDEEEDAVGGDVARVADLLDFLVGEGRFGNLGVEWASERCKDK